MPEGDDKDYKSEKESFTSRLTKKVSVNYKAAMEELETNRGPLNHGRKPLTKISRSDLCTFARQKTFGAPCPLRKRDHRTKHKQVCCTIR